MPGMLLPAKDMFLLFIGSIMGEGRIDLRYLVSTTLLVVLLVITESSKVGSAPPVNLRLPQLPEDVVGSTQRLWMILQPSFYPDCFLCSVVSSSSVCFYSEQR